jgi:hypothetical protein
MNMFFPTKKPKKPTLCGFTNHAFWKCLRLVALENQYVPKCLFISTKFILIYYLALPLSWDN